MAFKSQYGQKNAMVEDVQARQVRKEERKDFNLLWIRLRWHVMFNSAFGNSLDIREDLE